eukprot:gene4885-6898_t
MDGAGKTRFQPYTTTRQLFSDDAKYSDAIHQRSEEADQFFMTCFGKCMENWSFSDAIRNIMNNSVWD